jgi:heat shock protein beta
LAKSGTSEFLSGAESEPSSSAQGNLIGQFGLGFYSRSFALFRASLVSLYSDYLHSFLVADRVYVSSVAAKSDTQYVFSSSADEGSFEIYPDPRGNTLGRGTEITLVLKDDALEYLDNVVLAKLVCVSSDHHLPFVLQRLIDTIGLNTLGFLRPSRFTSLLRRLKKFPSRSQSLMRQYRK